MKIKFTILFAVVFSLLSSPSWSKENKIELSTKSKAEKTSKKSSVESDIPEIQSTDLTQVFSEAEKYYKAGQAWNKLKCAPVTGFICTKRECAKRDIQAYLILDKKNKMISRCEGEICDKFPATFRQTGVFFNVQTDGPVGTLIRILGDSRYKEITTVGLDAYIANGNCEVILD